MTLPRAAAWRHLSAGEGFEVVFLRGEDEGFRCTGEVAAVEDGVAWGVRYRLVLDGTWRTLAAHVSCLSETGSFEVRLEADGRGNWQVDGVPAPELAGCLDVDLEATAFTNALPIHRLGLRVGDDADAPAVYVRVPEPRVERLEQRYQRLPDEGTRQRYNYESPAFGYRDVLIYDEAGLIVDYPSIAVRVV